ncbi:MAG: nicotinate (nicotinamide) nucleotide adenylyltransferase [Muribaculaceae bacterium]
MQRKTVGILGGSFNPVHHGHLMLASYLVQWGVVDEVWLTLSPRNPLKAAEALQPDTLRLNMLTLALKGEKNIDLCDIELSMPRPSYTINTLDVLSKKYPQKDFRLIIGSDNWAIFERWRDYQRILDEYGVIVYPRPGYPVDSRPVDGMTLIEAPTINISSTFVRKAVAAGRSVRYFVPDSVAQYIAANKLYQNNE